VAGGGGDGDRLPGDLVGGHLADISMELKDFGPEAVGLRFGQEGIAIIGVSLGNGVG
jgi:hypothetical protein